MDGKYVSRNTEKENHKMLKKLLQLLQRFTASPTDMEIYVNSKHPKNAAEIDFWVRQYTQQTHYGR